MWATPSGGGSGQPLEAGRTGRFVFDAATPMYARAVGEPAMLALTTAPVSIERDPPMSTGDAIRTNTLTGEVQTNADGFNPLPVGGEEVLQSGTWRSVTAVVTCETGDAAGIDLQLQGASEQSGPWDTLETVNAPKGEKSRISVESSAMPAYLRPRVRSPSGNSVGGSVEVSYRE